MKALQITDAAAFGRVAVLMGGAAAERNISLNSGTAVFQALLRQNITAQAIDIGDNPLLALSQQAFDRVFNCVHGRGGEDGVLQAVLEVLRLPYTGSGVLASALTMDKLVTKLVWQGLGLTTPAWCVLTDELSLQRCSDTLGFPVIVKPAKEGSSLGMSKADNFAELHTAYQLAANYNCTVYAEQWIEGNEYTVGILDGEALPVIRLQTARTFYDYEAKYQSSTTQYHCPCGLNATEETALQQLALQAYHGVGVSGWGRVDVFIDSRGKAQLIEINTVPGMTDHSLVPMAAAKVGISFDELVWRILETSIKS